MEHQIKVAGMSCGHCVRSVTDAVHEVDQAAAVQVDLAKGLVTVRSDAESSKLGAAIVNAGYEVQSTAA
jgi:copper chaperone